MITIIKRTNERTTNEDPDDTAIHALPRRYERILWVVFGSGSAITGFIPDYTYARAHETNHDESAIYILDAGRQKGSRDRNHTHEHPDAATGRKWRYMRGACG